MLTIALIVMILGLLMYLAPTSNGKINEVGRIMFQVGLFFVLATLGSQHLRL
jgi:hypothetical protein